MTLKFGNGFESLINLKIDSIKAEIKRKFHFQLSEEEIEWLRGILGYILKAVNEAREMEKLTIANTVSTSKGALLKGFMKGHFNSIYKEFKLEITNSAVKAKHSTLEFESIKSKTTLSALQHPTVNQENTMFTTRHPTPPSSPSKKQKQSDEAGKAIFPSPDAPKTPPADPLKTPNTWFVCAGCNLLRGETNRDVYGSGEECEYCGDGTVDEDMKSEMKWCQLGNHTTARYNFLTLMEPRKLIAIHVQLSTPSALAFTGNKKPMREWDYLEIWGFYLEDKQDDDLETPKDMAKSMKKSSESAYAGQVLRNGDNPSYNPTLTSQPTSRRVEEREGSRPLRHGEKIHNGLIKRGVRGGKQHKRDMATGNKGRSRGAYLRKDVIVAGLSGDEIERIARLGHEGAVGAIARAAEEKRQAESTNPMVNNNLTTASRPALVPNI